MLKFDNLKIALEQYASAIVMDAKTNLISKDKVVSGRLHDSIRMTGIKTSKNSIEIGISMADYGGYIDKGVSGTDVKYDTPYSYKDKAPPPSALDGWMVQRGIAPRNSKGQFTNRKSIQFAISRSIFKNGIAPSNFLTEAVEKNNSMLPKLIKDKFALDTKSAVNYIIKSNKK